MFQSSGFFKSVPCPFYKHDLCHRPYCHFKHKARSKEKAKEAPVVEENPATNSDQTPERPSSPIETINDDVLNIVKNISPSKLIEYAKRKQEAQELQQTLEQVEKGGEEDLPLEINTEIMPPNSCVETMPSPALRSPEEIRTGLIDTFYSKHKVDVNITSGDIVKKQNLVKPVSCEKRRIQCHCDDPDCSGFLQETGENVFSHVSINQIDDEYTKRKMQRRLDRRKRALTNPDMAPVLDVVIRESDFFIPPPDVQEPPPELESVNGIDDDLSNYIDKCKEEYAKKLKEKKFSEKDEDIVTPLDTEECYAGEEEDIISEDQQLSVDEIVLGKKDRKKLSSDDTAKKKMLSDVNFFSSEVCASNTVISVSANVCASDEAEISSLNKEGSKSKSKKNSNSENNQTDSEPKGEIKKKRVFFPNELPAGKSKLTDQIEEMNEETQSKTISDKKAKKKKMDKVTIEKDEKCNTEIKKKRKKETGSSEKKNDEDVNNEDDNIIKNDKARSEKHSTKTNEKSSHKQDKLTDSSTKPPLVKNMSVKNDKSKNGNKNSKENIDTGNIKKNDDRITKGFDKNTEKENKIKTNNHRLEKVSSDSTTLPKSKGTKRNHNDSESSNASRTAVDIITLSSDDDVDDGGGDCHDEPDNYSDDDVTQSSGDDLPAPIDTHEHKHKKRQRDSTSEQEDSSLSSGKRIALTNKEIKRKPVEPRRPKSMKISYVSSSSTSTTCKEGTYVNTPVSKSIIPLSLEETPPLTTGKRRISHVKPTSFYTKDEVEEPRPKLAVDIGGKVPHAVRQNYYNKIIDEFIPKVATKKEAYKKGISEEGDAYKRSNRKQIYINLCANIVKRIRSMPNYVAPEVPIPNGDPMKAGQPTMKTISKPGSMGTNKKSVTSVTKNKIDIMKTAVPKVDTSKNSTSKSNMTPSVSRIQSVTTAGYQKIDPKTTIPKNSIKPASSKLVNAANANEQKISGKRERSISLTEEEPMELTEDNFYIHMEKKYQLTKELLWGNNYPEIDPDNPKLARKKDYAPSDNPLKRICCRCGKEYFMNKKGKYVTRNECHYHWGKLLRQRGRNANAMQYTCCGGDANEITCATCRLHVCNKVGVLKDYASTDSCDNKDSKRKVFALDCEMCYTTQGLELTRLTVIDFDLEQVIDLFVKPVNPIVDYNTRFSGVTREHLAEVTTTISDIHDILLNMFDKDTILLGHSLESDLNALNLIHRKVVDTAIVFPHRMGPPLKRALRNLTVEYLQKVIQSGEGGHDSCEDARSCMELMKYKFKEDQKSRKRAKSNS